MNNLALDEKACIKHKLTLEEALIALTIRHVKFPSKVTDNLLSREVLTKKEGQLYVTQHWSDVLDEILADSMGEQDEERLKALAKKMRDVYPEGRMIDRKTGQPTPYFFRCNPSEVFKKLKTFFVRYGSIVGDVTDEEIVEATKHYVATFRGNYQQAGFRQLKYFIWKDNPRQGPDGNYVESISPLLDALTNRESAEVGEGITEDWTSQMI
jgi:hypothetical protein